MRRTTIYNYFREGTSSRGILDTHQWLREKSVGVQECRTYFAYDEAGHLVGEYDNSGNLIQETIWWGHPR